MKENFFSKTFNRLKGWSIKNKKDLFLYLGFILVLIILIILAVAPQKGVPYNKVAINFFGAEIAWYAVFIISGIIIATVFAYFEFKRLGWKTDDLLDGLLIIVPLSIIGARLYYVLFSPAANYQTFLDVIKIWDGGLAIHGAIIVATISIIVFSKYKKLNFWTLADVLAVGLLIGQIAGRWGNFMNAEAHGTVTSNSFILGILPNFIKDQMQFTSYDPTGNLLGNQIYHPTFLYESIWNFVGLTALLVVRRKRILKAGDIIGIYLIWYGLGRGAIIEPLRTDPLLVLGIPVNILLSYVLFVGGGILILILKRVYIKNEYYYADLIVSD